MSCATQSDCDPQKEDLFTALRCYKSGYDDRIQKKQDVLSAEKLRNDRLLEERNALEAQLDRVKLTVQKLKAANESLEQEKRNAVGDLAARALVLEDIKKQKYVALTQIKGIYAEVLKINNGAQALAEVTPEQTRKRAELVAQIQDITVMGEHLETTESPDRILYLVKDIADKITDVLGLVNRTLTNL